MAQQNVEIVKRVLVEPFKGIDLLPVFRDEDRWSAHRRELEPIVAPECSFAWVALGQRVERTGLDGFREFWLDWGEPWESYRSETEEILTTGEKVVLLTRQRGRLRDTEDEVELVASGIFVVSDGRLVRGEFYANRTEGLEAAGLEE